MTYRNQEEKIWFVSDFHFNHGNIIKYCNRPFMNTEEQSIVYNWHNIANEWKLNNPGKRDPDIGEVPEYDQYVKLKISSESISRMNEHIINCVNDRVKEDHELFFLGDFAYCKNIDQAKVFRDKIICKNVHLILGNHDPKFVRSLFSSFSKLKTIIINNKTVVLCHFPICDWDRKSHGSYHLCGHSHGTYEPTTFNSRSNGLCLDVGVDVTNFKPLNFVEITDIMSKKIS